MFTVLKNGDFANATLMFQRGCENVSGGVDVAIMRHSAIRALPLPYSKPCDTSRSRRRQSATRRTGLGTPAFVNIDIHSLPSGTFIPHHMSEACPTSIENGLCHFRFRQLGRAYVANRYQLVLPNNPRRLFVKVVASSVRDFRVDRSNSFLVSGTLRNSQRSLILPIVTQCRNNLPITGNSQFFQPKINADPALSSGQVIANLALKRYIPTAPSVLHKGSGFKLSLNLAAFPKAVSLFEIDRSVFIYFSGTWNERNPTQGTLGTKTGAEARAKPELITRFGELATNLSHSIRVQPKISSTSSCQFDQIKSGRPTALHATLPASFSFALCGNTEIPHLITGDGMGIEATIPALDPIFESDKAQFGSVLSESGLFKSASSDSRPSARSSFIAHSYFVSNALPPRSEGRGFCEGELR